MAGRLAGLYRYPVKGLGPEALSGATVARGGGIRGDRAFAIVRGRAPYDDARPRWMRKDAFVMLMREGDERLARLGCAWEHDGRTLLLAVPGKAPCRADLDTVAGREAATRALDAFLGRRADGPVRVVPAGALSLTDIPENGLSLVNLASVADLAEHAGRPVDPLRFRANLYLDGLPAWIERDWVGATVRTGDVALAIDAHIHRCKATQVDPATGARDLDVLRLLRERCGHVDMGVYATVAAGGRLAVGAPISALHGGASGTLATAARRARFYARNAWVLGRSWLRR